MFDLMSHFRRYSEHACFDSARVGFPGFGPVFNNVRFYQALSQITEDALFVELGGCIPENNFKVHGHSKPFNVLQDHT